MVFSISDFGIVVKALGFPAPPAPPHRRCRRRRHHHHHHRMVLSFQCLDFQYPSLKLAQDGLRAPRKYAALQARNLILQLLSLTGTVPCHYGGSQTDQKKYVQP